MLSHASELSARRREQGGQKVLEVADLLHVVGEPRVAVCLVEFAGDKYVVDPAQPRGSCQPTVKLLVYRVPPGTRTNA